MSFLPLVDARLRHSKLSVGEMPGYPAPSYLPLTTKDLLQALLDSKPLRRRNKAPSPRLSLLFNLNDTVIRHVHVAQILLSH